MADRRARYAISAMFFVNGAALAGYVAHLADIQAKLHLTNGQLGRSILFSALGAITTMPLTGPFIHRVGSRAMTLIGLIALLFVLPWLMTAPTTPAFCAVLYTIGVSNGQFDVAMNTHSMAVQDRFPRPIISAIHGWFSLGGFVGAGGVALGARLGVSPIVQMVAASLVLAAVGGVSVAGMLDWNTDKHADPPRLALPSGRTLFLGALVLFSFVSEGSLWDWSTIYLRRVLLSGPALGALGFGFASVGMALARFLGDRWTHRFGYVRTLCVSALIAGGGVLFAVGAGGVWSAIAGFTLAGIGVGNLVPLLFRAAARLPGMSASTGLAAVTTCGYAGFLGGPPLLGFVADRKSLAFALGLVSALCLAVAINARRAVAGLD